MKMLQHFRNVLDRNAILNIARIVSEPEPYFVTMDQLCKHLADYGVGSLWIRGVGDVTYNKVIDVIITYLVNKQSNNTIIVNTDELLLYDLYKSEKISVRLFNSIAAYFSNNLGIRFRDIFISSLRELNIKEFSNYHGVGKSRVKELIELAKEYGIEYNKQ